MTLRNALARCIELVFPVETARVRAERIAKRDALQWLLNASHELRANGYETNRINARMNCALRLYERGRYEHVRANLPVC